MSLRKGLYVIMKTNNLTRIKNPNRYILITPIPNTELVQGTMSSNNS